MDWTNSVVQDGYSEVFWIPAGGFLKHLYHVPKLDYSGEDIKIEFDLTVKKGEEPYFAAAFCTENGE